jgi:osmoprotectant transport system permease protein
MRARLTGFLALLAALALLAPAAGHVLAAEPAASPVAAPVAVGSKRFTESYVLGEIVVQTLRAAGIEAVHRQGLGNTAILEQALARGEVLVYPEYTGTIARELLKGVPGAEAVPTLAGLNALLASRGLEAAVPLGFNNTYALALREADAQRLGLATISDLARLPAGTQAALRTGLSHEFLVRADGWPALARAYGLALRPGPGLDHGLAFQALAGGQVDLIDVYSTDAQIGRLGLRVLHDDRGFFPRYDAVLLMRTALPEPARRALAALEGRLDEATMVALNAEAEIDRKPFDEVARGFLARQGGGTQTAAGATSVGLGAQRASASGAAGGAADVAAVGANMNAPAAAAPHRPAGFWARLLAPDLPRLLAEHLALVFGSLVLAVAVGVPLGVWAEARPRAGAWLRGAVGLLQTVPSLALLAVLVAVLGRIGFVPALLALFAYALLPIVGNTIAGVAGVPRGLVQAAMALGLPRAAVLRHVMLPLALPVLLAGVTTAAVINVGTATVAAFVGAGGLGERIVAGLAVNDPALMLAGALPAALLAVLVQLGFGALERRAGVPR